MFSFLPLGGANEIGASCYYLNIDGTGIILDSGTHPHKTGVESLPNFDLIKDLPVDVGIISHAHQDHIDSLPYLVQKHPYIRLIATSQTRAIAELTLHNTVRILEEQLKDSTSLRAYTHNEIDLLIQSIEWKNYGEQFTVQGYRHNTNDSVEIKFYDAGHILGSSGILLKNKNHSLFFTGDICIEKQFVFPGASLPKHKVNTLITECTMGSTDPQTLPSRNEEMRRFALLANKVLESGGAILIPVFALGKLQEMLAMIWNLMQSGKLSTADIYTGGLGKKLCRVYDKNRYVVPYNETELLFSDIPQKDLYEVEQMEELAKKPAIILASSGMVVEGTLSFKLAQRWLQYRKNAIFTVGYMDPDSPGFKIQNANQNDTIQLTEFSEPQIVKCAIEKFRFSAHNNRNGLLEIVETLAPDNVILVHGDSDAIDWMGHTILSRFPKTKVFVAEIGRTIPLE